MKYDCTKAKDFLHELSRLMVACNKAEKPIPCAGCPLAVYDVEFLCLGKTTFASGIFSEISENKFNDIVKRLQKWSDSHPEKRELTNDERTILKTLHIVGYRYIARDNDYVLKVFNVKPIKDSGGGFWYLDDAPKNYMPVYMPIGKYFTSLNFDGLFDGLFSFDDEEPAEIEELLK